MLLLSTSIKSIIKLVIKDIISSLSTEYTTDRSISILHYNTKYSQKLCNKVLVYLLSISTFNFK